MSAGTVEAGPPWIQPLLNTGTSSRRQGAMPLLPSALAPSCRVSHQPVGSGQGQQTWARRAEKDGDQHSGTSHPLDVFCSSSTFIPQIIHIHSRKCRAWIPARELPRNPTSGTSTMNVWASSPSLSPLFFPPLARDLNFFMQNKPK